MIYSQPQSAARRSTQRAFLAALGVALLVGLSACTTLLPTDEKGALTSGNFAPVVVAPTAVNAELRLLPAPARRVTVAVYDFPDLTGQFKDSDNFQTLSKAVSQGGATMLIKALQDAGQRSWFTVLDRSALNDLLKERQIVTEMRKVYRGEQNIDPSVLPPLANASIVLEGGITGYDTNTQTGGAGANFLGIGANTKWTQDTITVSLRAVSAKTSEVLASVTVNKVIDSVALDGNVFLYVQVDKLLQTETGYTQNEPKQIAVQGAVEKAVKSLIMEGAQLHVWSFADRSAGDALIAQYNAEKYGATGIPDGTSLPVTRNAAVVVQTRALPVNQWPRTETTVTTLPPPTDGDPSSGGDGPPTDKPLPPPQDANGEPLN